MLADMALCFSNFNISPESIQSISVREADRSACDVRFAATAGHPELAEMARRPGPLALGYCVASRRCVGERELTALAGRQNQRRALPAKAENR